MLYITAIMLVWTTFVQAQQALDIIRKDPSFAVTNYALYPDSIDYPMTAAPAGKRPFYLSHYGRHGSRYINKRMGYDIPYFMMCRADSLGQLTPTGHEVLRQIREIIADSELRWGDLTGYGHLISRQIAARMVKRFPELFEGDASVYARKIQSEPENMDRCLYVHHVVHESSGQPAFMEGYDTCSQGCA